MNKHVLLAAFACIVIAGGRSAHADPLADAEAAFQRGDHAMTVKALLPLYRRGELGDARGLYLLSRGCYFAKPSVLKGALAAFDRSCSRQSGEITRRAAQAGSVEAMLDLTYTMVRPDRSLAHPDLRPDPAQAYGWALLAASLASDGKLRKHADEEVAQLGHMLRSRGKSADPLLERASREASTFFVNLAPRVRPDLAPPDGALPATSRFRSLGWVDIPGTADISEMKEGADQLYLPTLRGDGRRTTFHVSLSDIDTWRIARMEGDCRTSRAWILDDTDWQGYEGTDHDDVPLRPVSRKTWDEADPGHMKLIVDFACVRVQAARGVQG